VPSARDVGQAVPRLWPTAPEAGPLRRFRLARRELDCRPMPPADEQRILITQAAPGMVLSRPVVLPTKISLCARGTVLTEALVTRLMARGIKRVHVQGHPLPGPSQDAYLESIKKLHDRFSRVRHIPLMVTLHAIVERVMTKRL
jgi:hypothetical protein